MRRREIILFVVAGLAWCSISNATITNVTYSNYSGGAMSNAWAGWDSPNLTLNIHGQQYSVPGLGGGTIYTQSAGDPTLTLHSIIDNDTTFAWNAYHVNVTMSSSFTLSNQFVNLPNDWTATITQQPILTNSVYVGQLDYFSGAPVPIGGTLDFGFDMIFSGATQFGFTIELSPVPEPGTLGLVIIGGLVSFGFAVARRRRRA